MGVIRTWLGDLELVDRNVVSAQPIPLEESVERILAGGLDVRRDLVELAIENGLVPDFSDYRDKLHRVMIEVARTGLARAATTEAVIIQAVEALDDLDESTNLLAERLSEWQGLLCPEERSKGEQLAQKLKGEEGPSGDLANGLLRLYEARRQVEDFVSSQMQGFSPNMSILVGPIIAARLMSLAGGLGRLARMPGSRIQVLGAEQALFRHLKGRAPSPKHGIIFQHPVINTAPWWQRGKISRALSSKLAIAARIDYFSGELHPELEEDLRRRIEEIREKYPRPPEREKK